MRIFFLGCKNCNWTGYKKILENGREYFIPCTCKLERDKKRRENLSINSSSIPLLYRDKSFENFFILEESTKLGQIYKQSILYVKEYLNKKKYSNGLGLYLQGPVNSGKTFLTSLICKDLLKNNLKGEFYSFSDFLNNISLSWSEFLQKVKKYDFLILDKFIFDFNLQLFLPSVEDIISHYFESKKILIITSRISISRLKETKIFKLVPTLNRFLEEVSLPISYDSEQILKLKKEYNY